MERLYLLDAYALIYRSYYAFMGRPMRNRQGINTSAVFGFTKFLRDILMKEAPRYMGVAFDPKGGTFRNELYPQYKANRNETPEDIVTAVPYIKRILEAMRIPCLEVPGYEADDVIGTLARKAAGEGFEVYMVTPDKDFGQLIDRHVYIYKQRRNGEGVEIVGCEQLREQYGIDDPRLVIDILALWGDAADNIPGVPGIGEKSAVKLVNEFGTVENILAHTDALKGKQKENILAGRGGCNCLHRYPSGWGRKGLSSPGRRRHRVPTLRAALRSVRLFSPPCRGRRLLYWRGLRRHIRGYRTVSCGKRQRRAVWPLSGWICS